jgi:predicted nucleotidyltransferase
MPDDADILGFSNRWYAKGIETAVRHPLTDELKIKHLTPDLFVATKLEAHLGRGEDDLMMSRDMEDILLVVDGREELVMEIQSAEDDIRHFVSEQFCVLKQHFDFDHFLAGNIRGPEGRVDIVRERIAAISNYDDGG